MTKRLFFEAIGKVAAGIVLVAALLFLPAGTLRWPDGWLLIVILFVPMFAAGVVMMLRSICPVCGGPAGERVAIPYS